MLDWTDEHKMLRDAIRSFVDATITDLESRNPGLKFRTHWISKLGFGRDEEYAPYSNETRISTTASSRARSGPRTRATTAGA